MAWHTPCFGNAMNGNLQLNRRGTWPRAARPLLVATALVAMSPASYAQVVLDTGALQFTTEAFANFTAGDEIESGARGAAADDARFDGGARVLSRLNLEQGPDVGVRLAVQATEDEARLIEAKRAAVWRQRPIGDRRAYGSA
jgi:hypothetical protein